MKEIAYRGGVVRFRIPADWKEEYGQEGGGTFYSDRTGSGTLRLNVMTLEAPRDVNAQALAGLLRDAEPGRSGAIQTLPTGNVLLSYTQTSTENGQRLLIYYWQLANAVPPKNARLAVFSFTILADQEKDPEVVQQIQMLNQEISSATFSSEFGISGGRKKESLMRRIKNFFKRF